MRGRPGVAVGGDDVKTGTHKSQRPERKVLEQLLQSS